MCFYVLVPCVVLQYFICFYVAEKDIVSSYTGVKCLYSEYKDSDNK